MKSPLISIITSSFNQGQFIEETIISVLRQDYKNVEYVLIDGGSNDSTKEVLERYSVHFAHLISEKDKGCADALNKGLALIKGDIFIYLNSDDKLLPGALNRFVEYYIDNPRFDIYYGHGFASDEIKNLKYRIYSSKFPPKYPDFRRTSVIQPSTFFRTKSIKNIRFNDLNKTCWDLEFLVDLYLNGCHFKRLPFEFILSEFRRHQYSISGSGERNQIYSEDLLRIRRKCLNEFFDIRKKNYRNEKILDIIDDPKLYLFRIISSISGLINPDYAIETGKSSERSVKS